MRTFGYVVLIILGLTFLSVILRGCGFVSGWVDDGTKTAHEQFDPSALLKKYEEFKDLSAAIDKKRADIDLYSSEIVELKSVQNMDREDKFYMQQRKSELLGIIAIHNDLCAQYNSAMSKFNYKFCNKGDMPVTNLEPLPREFKPYINSIK